MWRDLQRLFRESVAAFRAEVTRREPEDQVAELLSAMRRELTAARAALPAYQDEVRRAKAELERERTLLEQCERRRVLAERIGDAETVRVAEEFAGRHRERVAVLEQRAAAAEAELMLRTREAEEMRRKYLEADANRFALVAQLRRSQAGTRLRAALDGSEGPFADFSRMEEAVEANAGYADAVEDLSGGAPPGAAGPAPDVEERLREIKRRMGKE